MDKSIAVRRKAQKLARDGQIQRAIEEMERVLQGEEIDPYDFVFHGDLLARGNRFEDAIAAFQEAVSAYERVGLFRNAIAVGKKILRADPTRARTYRRLGELYAKEGLIGDAVHCYLTFLDKAGGEVAGEEFLATLERIAEICGPKVEVALRLADLYVKAGHEERAGSLLEDVAREAEACGGGEIAQSLRERARELVPQADAPEAAAEVSQEEAAGPEPEAPRIDAPDPPPARTDRDPETKSDPAWQEIEEAWLEERWSDVMSLAELRLEGSPNDRRAVEKLVAVSRRLGDTLATVRYLTMLGDLRIAAEDLAGALECFLEVLEHDPQSATARRRVARFREMNVPGAERISEECGGSIQGVIETNGATVSVRESGGVETEEWIDLTTLLQEFREGIRSQVDAGDYSGHYDLGLSHLEMGLHEEALEEFDQVLMIPGIPGDVELKTREMRGTCLRRLERYREAIHEYRAALDVPDRPEEERNAVRYQLASALESAGEVQEARKIFRNLAEEGRSVGEGGGPVRGVAS